MARELSVITERGIEGYLAQMLEALSFAWSCNTCRSCDRGVEGMNDSARYVKIVEWSDEDHCYVDSAPGFIYGGCHGDSERAVFDELCQIVEEVVDLYRREGRPLPPRTSGRDFANKKRQR